MRLEENPCRSCPIQQQNLVQLTSIIQSISTTTTTTTTSETKNLPRKVKPNTIATKPPTPRLTIHTTSYNKDCCSSSRIISNKQVCLSFSIVVGVLQLIVISLLFVPSVVFVSFDTTRSMNSQFRNLICTIVRRHCTTTTTTTKQWYLVAAFSPTRIHKHYTSQSLSSMVSGRIRQPGRSIEQHPNRLAALTNAKQQLLLQRSMSTTNHDATKGTVSHDTDDISDDNYYYDPSIFDSTVTDFQTLGITSTVLLQRLHQQQLFRPTKVQVASYPVIASANKIKAQPVSSSSSSSSSTANNNIDDNETEETFTSDSATRQQPQQPQQPKQHTDVTIGCETGSGKTLAYLLPIIDDILHRKSVSAASKKQSGSTDAMLDVGYDYARAIILVPNKELVQQVVRMAAPLSGGARHAVVYGGHTLPDPSIFDTDDENDDVPPQPHDIVRIAIMPGGLKEPMDFVPFRQTVAIGGGTQPPIDLLISTPASIGPLALSPKHIAFFADIQTIVVDEADMLLDGGYIRALENVLMGFKRADRLDAVKFGEIPKTQHVFVAATLPNYGLRSVDAYLCRKFPKSKRVELDSLHMARHSGLIKPTVWMEMESKKDRMMKLVELFQKTTDDDIDSLQNEKVMIFLNSVADCEASCEALQRAGVHCAPYHAQIPLSDRTAILDRFRQYDVNHNDDNTAVQNGMDDATSPIPVLVCTDLASRGLDVPGVSVVVQLQFCGNVVGHLHRMGRCGRGGNQRQYGRGYVFYGMKERALVETVKVAELEQEQMVLPGDVVTKDWDSSNDDITADDITSTDSSPSGDMEQSTGTMGKITTAFSRKRGFNKKLRKLRRSGGDDGDDGEEDDENI